MKHNLIKLALFALVIGLFLIAVQTIKAQSALDGFDPNANGIVRVIVVQPDGKILIGGDFAIVLGVTRNRIARLNADGTLDTTFNPNANGSVFAIAVQSDGKILVGGAFNGANSIGTTTRNFIARLDATTGAADSFDPNANSDVYAIAVQSDGKILVGGGFTGVNSIGGQPRNRIARLDATTGAADSFDPNANSAVFSIAVQSDGKILVGGDFSGANSIGATTRNFIARLGAATGAADSFNPNANGIVRSIAMQSDGRILVGGSFSGANSIGGQPRNRIARLDATTGAADSFDPNANSAVFSIAVQSDGKILVGGAFNGANSIGATTRNFIARLDATTGLADSFDPNANGAVRSIAVQSDGKILAGGVFLTLQPNGAAAATTRSRIARLERDGSLDQTLNLSTIGSFVLAIAIQTDGKVLIGGTFSNVLGVARNNIARLNADGTLDTTFNPNANNIIDSIAVQADGQILTSGQFTNIGGQPRNRIARLNAVTGLADLFDPNANNTVVAIAVQSDGKILAGGFFTNIGGQPRNGIARLDPSTGLAESFDPNANNTVLSIAVQSDGRILAAGFFTNIGGQTRNRIARLNADGTLDPGFNPNANSQVYTVAVQSDGKVLAGGIFTAINGVTRNRIARLDATTGLADSFDPNANNVVWSVAVQADGKVIAGGNFTNIGGQPRNRIARIDGGTGMADSFNPDVNGEVYSLGLQPDGKILVGGLFTTISGQSRSIFARLSNDTAALSTLGVTQTTLTLTRDGSAAQFSRVIFEQSIDNGANYTLLGTATNSFASLIGSGKGENPFAPNAAGYTLGGQNIPTGQNVLIRARGFYHTGYQNGSETTEDKVRNVFLVAPTAASVSVSGRVTANGAGLRNAVVTLTDTVGNSRNVRTSSFGYYQFDDIEAGQTVIISVASKRFTFAPQVVSVTENIGNLDFTATP